MSHHLPSLCQRKNAGNLFSEAPGIITFWENRDQAAATSNNPLPSCCYCLLTQILILKFNHHTEPVGPLYNALLFTYIYFPPITPHCFLLYFFCCILRLFLLKVFCLLRSLQFAANILFFLFYCLLFAAFSAAVVIDCKMISFLRLL